jgi:putative flippase GtrA
MTLTQLILRYSLFAAIATVSNLAMQRVVLAFGDTGSIFALAVGLGTIVGLVIKYFLDKHWIFGDRETGLKKHGQKFTLYTAMGIVTTFIFWGMETVFWLVWQTDLMREVGALIGLSVGYILKYNLDRRFVFADENVRSAL